MPVILFLIALLIPSMLRAQEIILEHDCRVPVEHVADSDVNYKPEGDVTPADLSSSLKSFSYPIEIPVTIDFIKWMELEVPEVIEEAGELDAVPAHFTLHEDGRLDYNGQDISEFANVVCSDAKPENKTLSPEQQAILEKLTGDAKANGQPEAAVVVSPTETPVNNNSLLGEAIEGQSP